MKKIITIIATFVLLITGVILYSRFIGTKGLITNEIKLTANIDDNYNGLKIVHFTDLHYGRTVNENDLVKIVEEINSLKPDIVVFTGDLLDEKINLSVEEYDKLASLLNTIDANLGKFIITGNHDTSDKWENIITAGGFTDLNDKYQLIYSNSNIPIIISGLSSNINASISIEDRIKPINDYLSSLEVKPEYSILLLHEPDYVDKIDTTNFNLILAGHTHGGQIRLPFIGPTILPTGGKKYHESYYKIGTTDMYISSGLGTSTINYRFMDKPSINFYRLMKKTS